MPDIHLMITGQIRDEILFERLLCSIADTQNLFASITFSSWASEMPFMQERAKVFAWLQPLRYAVCPALPFGSNTGNRDVSSFLAQCMQISTAVTLAPGRSYTMRLRADQNCGSPDELSALLRAMSDICNLGYVQDKFMVFGANDFCPFFFEDRIMFADTKKFEEIKALSLVNSFRCDYFNIFPEFMFYSVFNNDHIYLRYDHRFRLKRSIDAGFDTYDFITHGGNFKIYIQNYIQLVVSNVVFFSDCLAAIGKDDSNTALFGSAIPENFRIRGMGEYIRRFFQTADIYERALQNYVVSSGAVAKVSSTENVLREKSILNDMHKYYFLSDYNSMLRLYENIGHTDVFRNEIKEYYGCALYHGGNREESLRVLTDLHAVGYRGFEQMYYLCHYYRSSGKNEDFDRMASDFSVAFSHIPRTAELIRELSNK